MCVCVCVFSRKCVFAWSLISRWWWWWWWPMDTQALSEHMNAPSSEKPMNNTRTAFTKQKLPVFDRKIMY